jgi:hypothetical protein
MENELRNWILEKRDNGICIPGYTIQKEATEIYDRLHPINEPPDFIKNRINFQASRGWLYDFCLLLLNVEVDH